MTENKLYMDNYNCYGRGCKNLSLESENNIICENQGCTKLDSFNWLKDIPDSYHNIDLVEVRFKNTRKGIFKNVNNLKLRKGDIVAVEASPGHDIGVVSLTGVLVLMHLKANNVDIETLDKFYIYLMGKSVRLC